MSAVIGVVLSKDSEKTEEGCVVAPFHGRGIDGMCVILGSDATTVSGDADKGAEPMDRLLGTRPAHIGVDRQPGIGTPGGHPCGSLYIAIRLQMEDETVETVS